MAQKHELWKLLGGGEEGDLTLRRFLVVCDRRREFEHQRHLDHVDRLSMLHRMDRVVQTAELELEIEQSKSSDLVVEKHDVFCAARLELLDAKHLSAVAEVQCEMAQLRRELAAAEAHLEADESRHRQLLEDESARCRLQRMQLEQTLRQVSQHEDRRIVSQPSLQGFLLDLLRGIDLVEQHGSDALVRSHLQLIDFQFLSFNGQRMALADILSVTCGSPPETFVISFRETDCRSFALTSRVSCQQIVQGLTTLLCVYGVRGRLEP